MDKYYLSNYLYINITEVTTYLVQMNITDLPIYLLPWLMRMANQIRAINPIEKNRIE